jgi:hypothetical protein
MEEVSFAPAANSDSSVELAKMPKYATMIFDRLPGPYLDSGLVIAHTS